MVLFTSSIYVAKALENFISCLLWWWHLVLDFESARTVDVSDWLADGAAYSNGAPCCASPVCNAIFPGSLRDLPDWRPIGATLE
jgi:hypothetical protein